MNDQKAANKNNYWARLLLYFVCMHGTSVMAGVGACQSEKPLVFGFLPMISAERLVNRFFPLVQYLSDSLGTAVRFETAPDFQEFSRRTLKSKQYDILYTAPHFFYMAKENAGYRMVAGVDSLGMHAIIVVPKDSDIDSVGDLPGHRLATADPLSLATLLVKKHLLSNGIKPDTDLKLVATPTHIASLLSTLRGKTDASALMTPPYYAAKQSLRDQMKIIATTELSPHIPISVAPWLSDDCARLISYTLVHMNQTETGRAALRKNRFKGFTIPKLERYNQLEWAVRFMNNQ